MNKETLKTAGKQGLKAAVIAFAGALGIGWLSPTLVQSVLAMLGLN